jgi:hypothetical protein
MSGEPFPWPAARQTVAGIGCGAGPSTEDCARYRWGCVSLSLVDLPNPFPFCLFDAHGMDDLAPEFTAWRGRDVSGLPRC